jgi:hypothetical protein
VIREMLNSLVQIPPEDFLDAVPLQQVSQLQKSKKLKDNEKNLK